MDTPTLIGTGFVVLGLVIWFVCAYLCYRSAPRYRRRPVVWGVLGVLFGPFALFTLTLLPRRGS